MEIRYIRDYCAHSNANEACIWSEIKVFRNGENIALGKIPTSSAPLIGGTEPITNGIVNPVEYVFTNTYATPQNVEIDLGQVYTDLENVTVWHYYEDGRIFDGTKLEVSSDGVNWVTVFDSAISGTYAETAEGLSLDLKTPKVRYIKDFIQGVNGNHWIEIEAYSNGINVALGKNVTHAGLAYSGTPANVTDGDFSVIFETTGEPLSWVQIDLGAEIELQEIKVWHYFQDGRVYNGARTEISADGENWTTIFDSAISGTYAESAEGHSIDLWGVELPIGKPQLNINLGALTIDNIFLGEKQITNLYLGDISLIGIPSKPKVKVTTLTYAVRLDWEITKNTTSWNIYRSEAKGALGEKLPDGSFIKVNTYTDNSAVADTTYYYTVESKNADSNKATKSEQFEATPYSIMVYESKRVEFAGYAGWTVYGTNEVTADFGNVATLQGGDRLKIDTTERLRFELPADMLGSANTGGIIKAKIAGKTDYTIEYGIRFDSGFPWSKGGKVPGFSGGAGYTGGEGDLASSLGDGFSVRLMWREDGRIIPYVYHAGMTDKYGDTFGETLGYFTDTKEHIIKYYAVLNNGSNPDGILKIYLDGVQVFDKRDLLYRRDQSLIDTAHLAIFAGGSTVDWNMAGLGYIRLGYFDWR